MSLLSKQNKAIICGTVSNLDWFLVGKLFYSTNDSSSSSSSSVPVLDP
jgi:hypothetical protein